MGLCKELSILLPTAWPWLPCLLRTKQALQGCKSKKGLGGSHCWLVMDGREHVQQLLRECLCLLNQQEWSVSHREEKGH